MELSFTEAVNLLNEKEKIKVHRTFLGQVERGETDITTTKFRDLCKIYCADANWILDLKDI